MAAWMRMVQQKGKLLDYHRGYQSPETKNKARCPNPSLEN
jgi:hypothetical protein